MAEIVFGAGTSHSPLLAAPPRLWAARTDADRMNPELFDNTGVIRSFEDLAAAAGGRYDDQLSPEVWERHWDRCQAALDRLRADFERVDPDVVLIIGDDQRELYDETNQPAMAIAAADEMNMMLMHGDDSEFLEKTAAAYLMDQDFTFPGHAKLAEGLVRGLMEQDIDVAWMESTPEGKGFGHAYGFPIQRFLLPKQVPVIPFMLNTYYPPNQPSARRCFDLGRALRAAAAACPIEARIAILASGGLSHFVVDEGLDRKVLDAMHAGDSEALRTIPGDLLNSGSSEIRNWITVAGAMESRAVEWSDYVPIVRTEAGTGVGMAFLAYQ